MTSALLPLSFTLDQASALDTLEAVLAIARRGGLRLARLSVASAASADLVSMELLAADPDLLALFEARLRNVIGIDDLDSKTMLLDVLTAA
jgi:acetolactate synthase regulatory subunit